MGLLSLIRGLKKKGGEARLLVLGLDNAGKTTILRNLAEEEATNIAPTQGFNVKTLCRDNFNLTMWDIGGQRSIRPYWRNYFTNTDALIYVVDSTDRDRVTEAGVELTSILEEPQMQGVPLLIFANKQDLVGALTGDEIADDEHLNLLVLRDRAWQLQPCSAKDGSGLQDGMEWLMKQIK